MRCFLHDFLKSIIDQLAVHQELEIAFNGWLPFAYGFSIWFLFPLFSNILGVELHGYKSHFFNKSLGFTWVTLLGLLRSGCSSHNQHAH
eukprot:Gb_21797 [translate_table: standard]